MCGLVGVLGVPSKKLTAVFSDLIQIDVVRGWDSTGVAAISNKGPVVFKDVLIPQWFMCEDEWVKYVDKRIGSNFCLIGHNRAATKGKVTADNAHPFQHGHITLAHNGTLHHVYGISEEGDPDFNTDSETITYDIAKRGIEHTWENLSGAAALSFWDDETETLSLLRNEKRPLHYAISEDGSLLIYASEDWMIRGVAKRHKIALHGDDVWHPNPHYMHRFVYNSRKQKVTKLETELLEYKKPYVYEPSKRADALGGPKNGTSYYLGDDVQDCIDEINGKKGGGQKILPFLGGSKTIPLAKLQEKSMKEEQFLDCYEKCYYCQGDLINDYDLAVIIDDYHAACGDCASTADMNGMALMV